MTIYLKHFRIRMTDTLSNRLRMNLLVDHPGDGGMPEVVQPDRFKTMLTVEGYPAAC